MFFAPRLLVRVAVVVLSVIVACGTALAQSAIDGFNPGADNRVYTVAVQPDGKILVGGEFTMLGGGGTGTTARSRIGRLNPDGSVDAAFNPGANGTVRTLAVQPDGKILVGGDFTMLGGGGTGTTARSRIGRLNPDGSLDENFNPGADWGVFGLTLQPNSQILVGGNFTMLGGGGTGTTARNYLGRLNADGSLDAGFNPGADGLVWTFAVQPDGKILVGGQFTTLGGGGTGTMSRVAIGRLNSDGSLDASFNPGVYDGYTGSAGAFAVALQADGKIVVGGRFSALGGGTGTTPRSCLGRLNPDGSLDTAFDPGANDYVWSLAVQPDGKILVGGNFYLLGGGGMGTTARSNIGRLNTDGSVDPGFYPGANGYVAAIGVQPDGKIVIGGGFHVLGGGGAGAAIDRQHIGRLYPDGSLDADFDARADSAVYDVAVQPDGKILVGGSFYMLDEGDGYWMYRHRIGRLLADGSVDDGFNPGANGNVAALAVQPDGKILVGGCFTTLGGGGTGTTSRNYLGRLHPDGSLDAAFDPGANGCVNALAVQADGKILVGGSFTMLGGGGTGSTARSYIGRLNADGSLDASFNPGASDLILGFAVQPDGKILVSGWFHRLGGGGSGLTTRNHIGRLYSDGSLDYGFDPGANDDVTAVVVQPDGKILVSGWFTTIGGGSTGWVKRNHIARLDAGGWPDSGFDPGVNYGVWDLALQADGKIVVGGWFTGMGGGTGSTARSNIGRFNADGSLDSTFDPGANAAVYALALQPDGKVVVAGEFSTLGGGGTGTTTRWSVGRVTNPAPTFQQLAVNSTGSGVTWMRGGSAPEVWRVSFDWSTDGAAYAPLGEGARIAGGWALNGVSLPKGQNLFVRAQGAYATGFANADGSLTESVLNAWLPPAASVRGDFTGDLKSDILWCHAARGEVWLWPMDGGSHTEAYISTVGDVGWDIRGVGDQTGDGQADLLWRHATTGMLYLWTMNAGAVAAETYVGLVDPAYDIVGTGDYNGDGKSDILWRHQATGELWLWLMNGAVAGNVVYVDTVDLAYEVKGSGDLNGDGRADLVWEGAGGDVWVWLMNGAVATEVDFAGTVSELAYEVVAVADYTGDGKADLLWRHATRGELWVWAMAGTSQTGVVYVGTVGDTGYHIVGNGDYDGDGKADILWHHATRGEVWVWLMDGPAKLSEHYVGAVPDVGYRVVR